MGLRQCLPRRGREKLEPKRYTKGIILQIFSESEHKGKEEKGKRRNGKKECPLRNTSAAA